MPEDRSRVLAAICQICEQMFGESALTGVENFFELGGTSLDAVEMISILQAKHGLVIEYSDVFEAETLAGLADQAAQIGQADRADGFLGTANPVPD
jgi:nonribosomal peptide synthetase protein BlmIV